MGPETRPLHLATGMPLWVLTRALPWTVYVGGWRQRAGHKSLKGLNRVGSGEQWGDSEQAKAACPRSRVASSPSSPEGHPGILNQERLGGKLGQPVPLSGHGSGGQQRKGAGGSVGKEMEVNRELLCFRLKLQGYMVRGGRNNPRRLSLLS